MIPSNEELDKVVAFAKATIEETATQQVLDVIVEVYTGKWPRSEKILPPHFTVGDVRALKGWWHVRWLITELYSAYCGRATRFALMQAGITQEMLMTPEVRDRVLPLMADLTATEGLVITNIIEKAVAKLGNAPVDINMSKQMKLRYYDAIAKMAGHEVYEDDGKYD